MDEAAREELSATPTAVPAAGHTFQPQGLAVPSHSPQDLLSALTGMGGDDRADVVLAMQRTVGNRAVARLIAPDAAPIRAHAVSRVIQRNPKTKAKPTYVPYQIHVDRQLARDQFRALAMQQIFGGVREGVEWKGGEDNYTPAHSPYTVNVESGLVQARRAQAGQDRGMTIVENGRIAGADARAKDFQAGPASDEKTALLDEIDRRYFEATGDRTQTKIKADEPGKAQLWRTIRDEVLFQHEYLANLPPSVRGVIKASIKGRDLTLADYDRLFTIAKKIENLPPGQASDYASKITASTTDLDLFEASLGKYTAEMAERAKQGEERDKLQTKLAGLEDVYKKYRTYKDLLTSGSMAAGAGMSGMPGAAGVGLATGRASGKLRTELDADLKRHDFGGVDDFEKFIKQYEEAFDKESVNIAQDLLKKYAGKLHREAERYGDPGEVRALHQKLGGLRAQYATFETNAKVWNDYAANAGNDPSRVPGQGHLRPKVSFGEADAARQKAEAAKTAAQAEVKGAAGEHPVLQEDGLPDDKRIDKAALAKAGESELGGVLQRHIQTRMGDVGEASSQIEGNHELIYKMDKLMPQFYAQQGIRPGSIHDMIIQDKLRSDAILKLAKGIALAIIGIALAVVTFGTATPAILAAGAAVAGASLGVYSALEEYNEYTQQKALADVGLASDPSVVWLVVSIVGVGLDVAAAASAVKALAPAAKAFNAAGDLPAFTKAVQALERANQIEAKVARAAEKAAAARKGLSEASGELTKVLAGKAYSFPGPLADPEVYKAVVKMAREAIKTAVYDAQKFIEELRLARVKAGLGDLSPEELTKAKQAWAEAKALEAAENARYQSLLKQIPDAAKLDALIKQAGDAEKLERLLKSFPQAELESIFAKAGDSTKLALMLDSVGSGTGASAVRVWIRDGDIAKLDKFLQGLASREGKELAETSALTGKSVVIDSNTAISLERDLLGLPLNDAQKSRVAFVKSLPPGTEIRAGNATLGELGSDALKVKGVPLSAVRDSAEYKEVLSALENVKVRATTVKVGGPEGFLDRGLVADAFFAKTDPGVIPTLVTADQNVAKTLVNLGDAAAQKVFAAKGFPGLVAEFSTKGGFKITIKLSGGAERSIMLVPIK